jgi:hypothetical protein
VVNAEPSKTNKPRKAKNVSAFHNPNAPKNRRKSTEPVMLALAIFAITVLVTAAYIIAETR